MTWGLLAPARLESRRRTRTLGLAAAVREFNERAVPGIGGVWFGKQLMLATLGVSMAEQTGRASQAIRVANAIEALACAPGDRARPADSRVRGSTKLKNKTDLRYGVVSQSGFYVTQPMRMATVQALPGLGLVAAGGARFNTFVCTAQAEQMLTEALTSTLRSQLVRWITEGSEPKPALRTALSPTQPLPVQARILLTEQLERSGLADDSARRRQALAWVEALRQQPATLCDWDKCPAMLEAGHWHDLRAGSLLFAAREAAVQLLDATERNMRVPDAPAQGPSVGPQIDLDEALVPAIVAAIAQLRRKAQAFLDHGHLQADALAFCREATAASDRRVLESMVLRDGRLLCVEDGRVVHGPAHRGDTTPESDVSGDDSEKTGNEPATEAEPSAAPRIGWPEGISPRMNNLFLLNADLRGDLERWLGSAPADNEALA